MTELPRGVVHHQYHPAPEVDVLGKMVEGLIEDCETRAREMADDNAKLGERVARMEAKLEGVEAWVTKIDDRLHKVETSVTQMDGKIDRLLTLVETGNSDRAEMKAELTGFGAKLEGHMADEGADIAEIKAKLEEAKPLISGWESVKAAFRGAASKVMTAAFVVAILAALAAFGLKVPEVK